jgi:hypothetical protein
MRGHPRSAKHYSLPKGINIRFSSASFFDRRRQIAHLGLDLRFSVSIGYLVALNNPTFFRRALLYASDSSPSRR